MLFFVPHEGWYRVVDYEISALPATIQLELNQLWERGLGVSSGASNNVQPWVIGVFENITMYCRINDGTPYNNVVQAEPMGAVFVSW